jgi:hypothetical protein
MLTYIRDPARLIVWVKATCEGLKPLTGYDGPPRDVRADFTVLPSNARVRDEYQLAPQTLGRCLLSQPRIDFSPR